VAIAPAADVLAAFGAPDVAPRLLAGGQGRTFRAGPVVFKPVDDVVEAEWIGSVLHDLPEHGFRVNRPIRSRAGTWTVEGWSAWHHLPGRHDVRSRWLDVLAAGVALHRALRGVPRPAFLDHRDDPWSIGDRVAWGDQTLDLGAPDLAALWSSLTAFVVPGEKPCQVIHGDLSGNVLFADPAPPAVIDFVPYWRPADFGLAIVVADAIAWHSAGVDLVRVLPPAEDWRSTLARAAIYRLVTADAASTGGAGDRERLRAEARGQQRILDVLLSL
jgi:uncharacterized protein (TIGR02569 family)